jgi:hypothetical protein
VTKQAPAVSFIRTLDFQQTLRVCNAYPQNVALDVFLGKDQLTKEEPIPYKSCTEFKQSLSPGQKVDFRVGEAVVGTFTISDLPQSDATLMMVIYRHDPRSTAVAFESHVFPDSVQAQVAVIDTYKGKSVSDVLIRDRGNATAPRQEMLRYSTVVAVAPGKYDVVLQGDGLERSTQPLVAKMHTPYVVIRCGVDAEMGQSFPEEVVIFPHSLEEKSGTARTVGWTGLAVAVVALLQ